MLPTVIPFNSIIVSNATTLFLSQNDIDDVVIDPDLVES